MFICRISRHPFGAYAALLLLQILSTHHRCSARQITNDCAPSSCGNFLNISSPFRLNTDPGSCGDRFIELGCEDNVRLTLNLDMIKYYVEAISYSDSTIRLVDAAVQKDDCFSIPHHSLTESNNMFSSSYFKDNNSKYNYVYEYGGEISVLAFICCENQIPNPLPDYIMDTSSCKNSSGTAHNSSPSCVNMEGHLYVMVDGLMKDVPDLCRVNLMYTVPKNVRNMSYTDVHDILADGFELQWYNYEDPSRYLYILFQEGLSWIFCRTEASCNFRYTTPPVLLNFLMFLAPIVIYHVLLFPCGLPCLLTLLIYKWRRRHLSMYDNIEKFLQSHDNDLVPIRYTYSEIKKITNRFKDKLGEGGFGSVYKGKLRSGRFAAVKLLGNSKAGKILSTKLPLLEEFTMSMSCNL